jgi:hypothetical protein
VDYDHIKIKISCEMKNGYVWEIRTRILFYIALCIALVFMMQHSVTWKLPDFIELLLKYIVLLLSLIRFMAVLPLYTKRHEVKGSLLQSESFSSHYHAPLLPHAWRTLEYQDK